MSAASEAAEEGWFGWNPRDTAFRDDPFPVIARIREEHPVHRTPAGYWRIFRHADVVRVLRELPCGVRTTDGRLPGVDESQLPRTFMLMRDPPDHTRLRRLVSHAFTPPAIERMRPEVQKLVDDLLDRVEPHGEMDAIADLARPVPSTVICRMLGVPLEDRERFTDWTAHTTHLLALDSIPEAFRVRAFEAVRHLIDYMAALITERRAKPGNDMLTVLIRAEEDGDRLDTIELLSQSIGLLIAGFETTIGLIGNGIRQLLLHPEELARLRANPDLVESAVEECLRFEGPIPATRRVLHEDAEIGGVLVPKNEEVVLMLASAHRDPRAFREPERFDITRGERSHLAFGGGIHFCLGAHLARMETQVAIGTLVRRFDGLELASDRIEWGESIFRVLGRLPVRFTKKR